MLKKIFKTFAVIFIALFIVNVGVGALNVTNGDLSLKLPNGFKVISANDAKDNEDYLKSINFTVADFKKYLSSNSVIVYATDKNGSEIVVKSYKSDFSTQIDDLYELNEDDIKSIFGSFLNGTEYTVTDVNNNRFLRFEYTDNDNMGNFYGIQLLTVKNGTIYSVNYTADANIGINPEIEKTLSEGFNYKGKTESGKNKADTVITGVILALAIIAFLGLGAYIIYTFVRDIRKRRNMSDVAPYVKIKRRKF